MEAFAPTSFEIVPASIGAFLYDRSRLEETLVVLGEDTWSIGAGSSPTDTTADSLAQRVFDLVELSPAVYAAEVVSRPPVYAFANSLIVIGEDDVLVVDTQQSPAAARALIAEIRRLTDAPVRWVVNTHSHADHVYGNEAYRDTFPEVEFIAHEKVAAELAERGAARLRQEIAELPATIEARRRWLDEGRGSDGQQLDEEGLAAVRYSLRLREAYLTELRALELVGPTRTFDRRLDLRIGGREVRLLHFGAAHTRGDAVVYLPSERILATGDLIEYGLPYFGDAFPAGWGAVLDSIAALEAEIFVPGHGRVQRSRDLLHDNAELIQAIAAHARLAAESGKSPEDAVASLQATALAQRFEKRYGVSAGAFETGVREAISRTHDELSSEDGHGNAAEPFPRAEQLLIVDRDFAKASATQGADAWADIWLEEGLWYGGEDALVVGPGEVRRTVASIVDRLRWEPVTSGMLWPDSLGYTVGHWWMTPQTTGATVDTSRYLTVWRRVDEGWKVALDLALPSIGETGPADDFDFWLGDWTLQQRIWSGVENAFEPYEGRNRVRAIAGGGALLESFEGEVRFFWAGMDEPRRIRGASVRVYDPSERLWRIFWIDTLERKFGPPFSGTFSGGSGEFLRIDPVGDIPPTRIRFMPLNESRVHWDLAIRASDGAAWQSLWRIEFSRPGSEVFPASAQEHRPVLRTRITNAYPSYSPDGSKIAYMSNADGDFDIYVMQPDSATIVKLTDAPGQDGTPVWSPDGSQIAFRSFRDGSSQIYVMDADGGNQRNLSNSTSSDEHPFWSPVGHQIFFASDRSATGENDENVDLYVMDADGSNVRRITSTPEIETYPTLSPDGTRLATRRILADGNWEVVVVDLDGKDVVNLSNHPGFDGWPAWSPDGTRLVFASERSGSSNLWMVDADGSNLRQITDDPADDRQAWWSPDGSRIAFARYIWFPDEPFYEASEILEIEVGKPAAASAAP